MNDTAPVPVLGRIIVPQGEKYTREIPNVASVTKGGAEGQEACKALSSQPPPGREGP